MLDPTALTPPATFSTARLRLEPLGPAHLDGLLAGLADPETRRLTGTRAHFERADVERHLLASADDPSRADWAIIETESETFVGEVVLNELDAENGSMSFRIALAPGLPGRGFGTEATVAVLDYAFDRVGLHRVELEVFAFNPRAQRSYEKAGFVVEGRRRDALRWNDEWIDTIVMSVLATDARGHQA